MLSIFGTLLALAGAVVAIIMIVRALPRLPNPPTPEHHTMREAALKERLLFDRLTRGIRSAVTRAQRASGIATQGIVKQLEQRYRRLRLLAHEHRTPKSETPAATCLTLLTDADAALANDEYALAEERYLACLKIDQRHRGAYLGLSTLYQRRKEDALAEETLRFLRKLYPNDAEIAYEFSAVLAVMEKQAAALHEVQYAITLAPRNPKFLDFAIGLAMLLKRRRLASELLDQLRAANPENQKLEDLAQQIATIEPVKGMRK